MDGSVVEGNSTSLQTCPPGPQEHLAFEDLPSSPSTPLHENDLGLTPPPGSQQLQHTDAAQRSFQDEKPSAGNTKLSKQDETALLGLFDQISGAFPENQRDAAFASELDSLNHNSPDLEHMEDATGSYSLDDFSVPDVCPVGVVDDGFFDGFDSEAALRELQAALEPRKRTGDKAFPNEAEFWDSSVKKRVLGFPQASVSTSPEDTPSLSSPDSLLRTEQADSAPHTPPASENAHSPNSLFDSLDALFDDPNFQMPLGMHESPRQVESELPEPPVQTTSEPWNNQFDAVDSVSQMELCADHKAPPGTPISELTKERFGLNSSDLLSNTASETLRVCPKPQYTSPYPACGGPLGYFPSAPGIHVRYVEAVDRDVHNRICGLKDRVQQLTYERNKYRTAWNRWSTRDPATGKSKEQLLREENTRLRRASSQLQNKVEEYKIEAAEWRTRLNDLSIVYNNLLYEIHVQRQMPAVAPVPRGYKPPAGGGHIPLPAPGGPVQSAALTSPNRSDQPSANPPSVTTTPAPPPPGPSAPPGPSGPKAAPIMIDLTDEGDDTPAPPPPNPRGAHMIQSLRNKQYGWLQGSGQHEMGAQVASAPQSPAYQATPNAPERSRSHPPSSTEEELVRAMEAELARSD